MVNQSGSRHHHLFWLWFMRSSGLVWLLWLVIAGPVWGATPELPTGTTRETDVVTAGRLTFRTYNEKDGLPQNAIEGLGVDQNGYLWVGTQDGAARYNGREWTVVNLPERTTSNFIRSVLVASDGSLWFGRQDGGLAQRTSEKWTSFTSHNGLPANRVNCLAETRSEEGTPIIWAGTSGGGLAALNAGKWTVYNQPGQIPHSTIQCLAVSKSAEGETLWVGTTSGLSRLVAGRWTTIDLTGIFSTSNITSLYAGVDFDGNPTMWIGTDSGELALVQGGRVLPVAVSPLVKAHPVSAIAQTKSPDGVWSLWLGVEDTGLFRLQSGRWTVFDTGDGLPANSIKSLLPEETPTGTRRLWIGTDGAGLARLELNQWVTFNTAAGLPVNMVFSLMVTKNPDGVETLWAGTNGKGIACVQPGNVTIYDETSGLPNATAFALLETTRIENKRIIWAGMRGGGIARLVNGRWKLEPSDFGLETATVRRMIETVAEDGTPEIWAATGSHGLAHYRNGKWRVITTRDGLPTNRLFTVVEAINSAGERQLWVGTEGGGLACRASDGSWKVWNQASGLPNNSILSLLAVKGPDGTPTLWAGTEGGGAVRLALTPGNQMFVVFSEQSQPALPNNTIYQVQSDARGRIYLFTNKGVARLSPRTPTLTNPAEFDVYTFSIEDGLPNNEFNGGASCTDARGRIWGGSIGGAVVYDPAREVPEAGAKPLKLERFLINGEPIELKTTGDAAFFTLERALRYDENNLLVEFSLLSFFREKNTAYLIRLDGFDHAKPQWMTDFKKEYTNLPAGTFTLNVWGRDAGGTISGPLVVSFKVKPAPWLTWWAFLGYGLVAGSGIWFGARWRMRALEQRNLMLESKIAERTADLAQAVKETERKNELLEAAKDQVERKNQELDRKIAELMASQQQADRIFSALAEALPGTVLDGKYRLEEKIGSGGFGTVFRGIHLTLDRPVAVKVFRPRPGNDTPEAVERFRREGVSATRVNHPNAIQVLDWGISTEGIAFLVMELLTGHSLGDELKRQKRLTLNRMKAILQPVCSALAEAHSVGIIHRDIKPDNIFLHRTRDGEVVKVVDFGLAKFKEEEAGVRMNTGLTAAGIIIGTPTYMSPERLEGSPYDGRSDVYSVGIMMYEMVCGCLPFQPSSRGVLDVILRQIKEMPSPPREINPDLPESVERIILRALEKNPLLRPSITELEQAFLAALEGLPEAVLNTGPMHVVQPWNIGLDVTIEDSLSNMTTDIVPPSKETL